MANKNNATCSICGNEYYLCISCKDAIANKPWLMHTDTSEHYKIYQIIRGYSTGIYTENEAKTRLNNVDLSDLNTFRSHIKSLIEDIMKEDKKSNKADIESNAIDDVNAELENTEVVKPIRNKKYSKIER